MTGLGKVLYFILLSFGTVKANINVNIDPLISKANIYYQRALDLGEPRELILDDIKELNSKKDLKVIIHGFIGSRTHISIKPLGNAYMSKGVDNVFLADWEDAAGLDYHSSRKSVGKVAIFFGKMLDDFFKKHGIEHSDVHIIGHSLGAHIAGDIGQYFNGTLSRVTGLDPALPFFTPRASDSLHATAAQFVDVIHTDYPVFGDLTPRGTVDFYPNFGHTPQPGCDSVDLLAANSCSHNRAVILYAETIGLPKNFPSIPCSLTGIKRRSVNVCLQKSADIKLSRTAVAEAIANIVESQIVYMGEHVTRSASGYYYTETFDAPPFGMGVYTSKI